MIKYLCTEKWQVDIWGGFNYLLLPLEWIGLNAMLVYVMAAAGIFAGFVNGWYYDDPHNTIVCSFPPNSAFFFSIIYIS